MAVNFSTERERLEAVSALGLLDTAAEERFDRITRLTARFFGTPVAVVSLVDAHRQWFKSRYGLTITETPRVFAFCNHAIESREPVVVEDARVDSRFADNPYVRGEPGIRFYAGQPLFCSAGHAVGTLCIMDHRPRRLEGEQLASLRDFARLAQDALNQTAAVQSVIHKQSALTASEIRFRATFEQAAVGIAHLDLDGKWMQVNRRLYEILGYEVAQLERLPYLSIVHPDDLDENIRLASELLSGARQHYALEERLIHQSGESIWVNTTVSLVRNNGSAADYFIGVVEDIQEKKIAQAALWSVNERLEQRVEQRTLELTEQTRNLAQEVERRRTTEAVLSASERKIRTILEGSLDAFVGIDDGGQVTDWNAAAERILGWSREQALGRDLTELLIPEPYHQQFWAGLRRLLDTDKGGATNQRLEMPARTRAGHQILVEMTVSAYRLHDHKFFGAFLHDISARRAAAKALEQKQRLLDAVLETVDVGVVACSEAGELTLFNRAARLFHGAAPADVEVHQWAEQFHLFTADGKTPLPASTIPLIRALDGELVDNAEMVIAPKGLGLEPRFILASARTLISSSGEKLGAVATMKDVTELRGAAQQLVQSEERLRTVTDNLPVLIAYLDSDFRYRFANRQYTLWFGHEPGAMLGRTVMELFGEDFVAQRRAYMHRCLAGETVRFQVELDTRTGPHAIESIYIPHWENGTVRGFYILSTDITLLKQQERQLKLLARIDPLTGLLNRRGHEESLVEAMARSRRTGQPLALLFLDLDRFKLINDTFGHAGGDAVLKEFAQRLKASVRQTDTVARLAGDEFTVILEGVADRSAAATVADKILTAIREPFAVDEAVVAVSTSIGGACASGVELDVKALEARADAALYRAKAAGRGCFQLD